MFFPAPLLRLTQEDDMFCHVLANRHLRLRVKPLTDRLLGVEI